MAARNNVLRFIVNIHDKLSNLQLKIGDVRMFSYAVPMYPPETLDIFELVSENNEVIFRTGTHTPLEASKQNFITVDTQYEYGKGEGGTGTENVFVVFNRRGNYTFFEKQVIGNNECVKNQVNINVS